MLHFRKSSLHSGGVSYSQQPFTLILRLLSTVLITSIGSVVIVVESRAKNDNKGPARDL